MSRRTSDTWMRFGVRRERRRISKLRSAIGRLPFHRKLRVEPLEDRRLLATITVDTLLDEADGSIVDGDVSLRDAITQAAANDTINFAASLTSGGPATINLANMNALLINKALTINGPGSSLLTINAFDPTPTMKNADGRRVFNVNDSTGVQRVVNMSGLTLTGADFSGDDGGAIFNSETLTLTDLRIEGNAARVRGGGIASLNGNLTVRSSAVSGNSAGTFGGGINSRNGTLTVETSTISNNQAGSEGGGVDIFHMVGSATIVDSTISGNSSGSVGGGLNVRYGQVAMTRTLILSNQSAQGGGVFNRNGTLTLTDVVINENTASTSGGGVHSSGNVSVSRSTIHGNTATDAASLGGGIHAVGAAVSLTVDSSTISGNAAGARGGGINAEVPITLTNVTVSGNSAAQAGGAALATGTISFTTIANNPGGGILVSTNATLSHTIIAGNVANGGVDVAGIINSSYTLIGLGAEFLAPLAYNGGPNWTHALLAGSPAIEGGDPNSMAGQNGVPAYDQRYIGFARVSGPRIDIGAFEIQIVTPSLAGDYNRAGTVDAADYVLWRKTQGAIHVPAYSGADGDGNTTIDQVDYGVWRTNFGETLPPEGSVEGGVRSDEPIALGSLFSRDAERSAEAVQQQGGLIAEFGLRIRAGGEPDAGSGAYRKPDTSSNVESTAAFVIADFSAGSWELGAVSRGKTRPQTSNRSPNDAGMRDEAFVVWLASRMHEHRRPAEQFSKNLDVDQPGEPLSAALWEGVDSVFESLALDRFDPRSDFIKAVS